MTSEQFVRKYYPNAAPMKYKLGGFLSESFWRIETEPEKFDSRYFARSKSKSNAWVNARKEIQAEKGI